MTTVAIDQRRKFHVVVEHLAIDARVVAAECARADHRDADWFFQGQSAISPRRR
jgi:hypothetical protein